MPAPSPAARRDPGCLCGRAPSAVLLALLAVLPGAPLGAQGRGGGGARPIPPAPGATPIPIESLPPYVRRSPPADPVMQRIWAEGMHHSQAMDLAQALLDSVGPRQTASPGMERASAWAIATYRSWGIPARAERYGTFAAWERGYTHLELTAPRLKSLEAVTLSWSPGTGGRAIEGEVIALPDSGDAAALEFWLRGVRGAFVLATAPQLSCRPASQWAEFGTPAEQLAQRAAQDSVARRWRARAIAAGGLASATDPSLNATAPGSPGTLQDRLLAAGAAGVLTTTYSSYPGVDKIFGTPRQKVPTLDVGCEDYGLLVRLAERRQHPRVRLAATAETLGERPVFNTIAELRGREKPDEYVLLSAHFDSWTAGSGATDNGTGTITMMEAMRILKAAYPDPKRTIMVGHWSGEEQGLNGSRAFTEDHPEVVRGLQALFNQDNGTGRIVGLGPGALPGAAPVLQRYLAEIPSEITQWIRFGPPGPPAGGGSDNASFACHGAPAFGLGALGWDYGNTTWHTNRDTYDKLVRQDLENNATLVAMLAYLASEDPAAMPRERLEIDPRTNQPVTYSCVKALRSTSEYKR